MDDASWVMGFLDIIDPALDSIKRLLNLDQNLYKPYDSSRNMLGANEKTMVGEPVSSSVNLSGKEMESESGFDLDAFMREKLSLEPTELDDLMTASLASRPKRTQSPRSVWRPETRPGSSV